ncbi:ribonuclease YeeF family protein [Rossellomorea vietnamensis]|uniref:ribonuclease YeeF family protein n=1 Tax=Rossellomorea vietnamensis TaxID=218284 RepID=UPI001E3D60CE|nr:LXG domain-containing protein [Rossellomorea vietnamensis]MCC5803191.1 LXG domain-containing protein [Rossellomorea vietnamensis]
MKTLDNQSLHSGIEDLRSKLETQKEQLSELRQAVEQFSGSHDAFSGQGGEAVRSFYQDLHTPFLTFYSLSLLNYERMLTALKSASTQLESDTSGFIRQPFLDGELRDGLNRIESTTLDLVDETNQTLDSVRDIVHVPAIQDQKFLSDTKRSEQKITQTLEDLTSFDNDQTKALDTVDHDIQLMKRYIYEIEGMFKSGKISVDSYSGTELNQSFHRQSFMSTLEDKSEFESLMLSRMTISSEYDSLRKILLLNGYGNANLATSSVGKGETSYGVCYPKNNHEGIYQKEVADGWGVDGFGNGEVTLEHDKDKGFISIKSEGSVFDTSKMDNIPEYLQQRLSYGELSFDVPYKPSSIWNSLLYGQNIGLKNEIGMSHTKFSNDNFPLASEFKFAQTDAKINYENYTLSMGAEATAAKIELKLEPLNFFGYEPLEEWFGIDYDPYIGADLSLGSIGATASVGLENSVYAALGIGVGLKGGLEKDN